mmetsp:Transcript_93187/g.272747  ORF Transcript_93187/g.272747 Transcript_93187/m.272747 type:complete len:279 (+) Transcript_93187:1854-2690(+)
MPLPGCSGRQALRGPSRGRRARRGRVVLRRRGRDCEARGAGGLRRRAGGRSGERGDARSGRGAGRGARGGAQTRLPDPPALPLCLAAAAHGRDRRGQRGRRGRGGPGGAGALLPREGLARGPGAAARPGSGAALVRAGLHQPRREGPARPRAGVPPPPAGVPPPRPPARRRRVRPVLCGLRLLRVPRPRGLGARGGRTPGVRPRGRHADGRLSSDGPPRCADVRHRRRRQARPAADRGRGLRRGGAVGRRDGRAPGGGEAPGVADGRAGGVLRAPGHG